MSSQTSCWALLAMIFTRKSRGSQSQLRQPARPSPTDWRPEIAWLPSRNAFFSTTLRRYICISIDEWIHWIAVKAPPFANAFSAVALKKFCSMQCLIVDTHLAFHQSVLQIISFEYVSPIANFWIFCFCWCCCGGGSIPWRRPLAHSTPPRTPVCIMGEELCHSILYSCHASERIERNRIQAMVCLQRRSTEKMTIKFYCFSRPRADAVLRVHQAEWMNKHLHRYDEKKNRKIVSKARTST